MSCEKSAMDAIFIRDKQDYMKNSFHSSFKIGLLQKCVQILKLDPRERKKDDLLVFKKFLDNNDFFQSLLTNLEDENQINCCRYFYLEEFQKESIVFQQGDPGKKFYIILEGEVGIYINQLNPLVQFDKGSNYEKVLNDECDKATLNQKKIMKMVKIKSMFQGEQFGHLSLYHSQLRTATVICETDCKFAVLHKNNFNDIMMANERKQKQRDLLELQSFPGFETLSEKLLYILLYNLKSQSFKYREYVYRQGDQVPPKGHDIYIVQKGEFVVLVNQQPQIFLELIEKDEINSNQRRIETQVAILSKGSIFGDSEAFNPKKRQHSVRCATCDGVALCISFQELQQSVQATNEYIIIARLKEICEQKSQWRQFQYERVESIISEYKQYFTNKYEENYINKPIRYKTQGAISLEQGQKIVKRFPKLNFDETNTSVIQQRMIPIKSPKFTEKNQNPRNNAWQFDTFVQQKRDQFSRINLEKQTYKNLVDIQIKLHKNHKLNYEKIRIKSNNPSPINKGQILNEKLRRNSLNIKSNRKYKYSFQLSNSQNKQNTSRSRCDSIEFSNVKLYLLHQITKEYQDQDQMEQQEQQIETSDQQKTLKRVLNTGRFALTKKKQQKFQNSYINFLKNQ